MGASWGRCPPPPHRIRTPIHTRGLDLSTYCDYQLTFLLHIHGLPLSARRAFLILLVSSCLGAALPGGGAPHPTQTAYRHLVAHFLQVSASLFVGLVILYIVCCLLSPYMVKVCNILRWKINSIIGLESNYTYSTPSDSRAFSHSGTMSWRSSRLNSRVVYKGAEENKAET